jgi:hypothetical protein
MIRKEILKEIIIQNQNRDLSFVFKRDTILPTDSDKIISVTGVRRCGKTHLLLYTIKELMEQKKVAGQIVYMNFEDERLNLQIDELDLILQAYRELYPKTDTREVYFFFDEIQNLPGWEKFVRRVYDSVSRHLFITGSNSSILSSDISTSLRGRSINVELFPLSFKEYLHFKNIEPHYYDPVQKALIANAFNDYIIYGGFPEVISSPFRQKILQDYYYVMLYKDLIERYKISNLTVLKYFINRLVINTGKPSSINKIFNELKSAGHKISKDSLYQFSEYIEHIYFSFRLNKFDYSLVKQEQAEKKIYFIDNGLLNSLTYHFSDNYGSLLENAVFLGLRRKEGKNLFFYKDVKECDFVVFDKDQPMELIQVCFDIGNEETLKREINGIEKAASFFNLKKGIVIGSQNELGAFKSPAGIEIEVIPAMKWLNF